MAGGGEGGRGGLLGGRLLDAWRRNPGSSGRWRPLTSHSALTTVEIPCFISLQSGVQPFQFRRLNALLYIHSHQKKRKKEKERNPTPAPRKDWTKSHQIKMLPTINPCPQPMSMHSTLENECWGYGILPSVVTNHSLTATHSLTRPISQPIKQISQPNDGSINQSFKPLITQYITHSLTRPISQSNKSVNQTTGQSINQSFNPLITQYINCSSNQPQTAAHCRNASGGCLKRVTVFSFSSEKDPPPPSEQNGDDSCNKSMPTSDICNTLKNESVGVYGILPMTNHSLSHPATHSLHSSSQSQQRHIVRMRLEDCLKRVTAYCLKDCLKRVTEYCLQDCLKRVTEYCLEDCLKHVTAYCLEDCLKHVTVYCLEDCLKHVTVYCLEDCLKHVTEYCLEDCLKRVTVYYLEDCLKHVTEYCLEDCLKRATVYYLEDCLLLC